MTNEAPKTISQLRLAAQEAKKLKRALEAARTAKQVDSVELERIKEELLEREEAGDDSEPGMLRSIITSMTSFLFGEEALEDEQDEVMPLRALDSATLKERFTSLTKSLEEAAAKKDQLEQEMANLGDPEKAYLEAVEIKAQKIVAAGGDAAAAYEQLAKRVQKCRDDEFSLEGAILAATEAVGSLNSATYQVERLAKAVAPAKLNHKERKNELRYVRDYGEAAWEELTKAEMNWLKVKQGVECFGGKIGCSFNSSDYAELPAVSGQEMRSSRANYNRMSGYVARLKRASDSLKKILPTLNERWIKAQGERLRLEEERDTMVEQA